MKRNAQWASSSLWRTFKGMLVVLLAAALQPAARAEKTDPFQILFTFTNWSSPGPVALSGGTLYGTCHGGILFKLNTNGADFTILRTFAGYPTDGAYPGEVLLDGSTLYGTAAHGGPAKYEYGTLYKAATNGAGYVNLHFFDDSHGSWPMGALAVSGGKIYGATRYGGSYAPSAHGVVYAINTDGSSFTVLKEFTEYDGSTPEGGVVIGGNVLYGTTSYDYAGPVVDAGSIFKINTDGSGYVVLKHFSPEEGRQPQTPLILSGAVLYGSAPGGGIAGPGHLGGSGTIFKINTDGTGFTVLRYFNGPPDDGAGPGYLVLSGNKLFGATSRGGSRDYGVLFVLNVDGSGYTILKAFTNPPPAGIYPVVSAISGNTVFGSTYSSGFNDYGEIFSFTVASPTFSRTPQSMTAEIGANASFKAAALGVPAPGFTWVSSGGPIPGATNETLWLTNLKISDAGSYFVIATNMFGSITSTPAELSIIVPVERRPVPALVINGEVGTAVLVESADTLNPPPLWSPVELVILGSSPQWYFDTSQPLTAQRFYRTSQRDRPIIAPKLGLPFMTPAIGLTGTIGETLSLEAINAIGPIDGWFALATVTLTNTSQFYFDLTAPGQPERLYRVTPVQ